MLTVAEVKHIAKLARLHLTEAEIEKYARQLSGILDYAQMLNEVDTEKVQPIAQITGLQNVSRPDEVQPQNLSQELLKCTPQTIEQGQIKVKSVF